MNFTCWNYTTNKTRVEYMTIFKIIYQIIAGDELSGWVGAAEVHCQSCRNQLAKKEKRKTTLMLSRVWIMVTLLHFQVGPSLSVITKWTLWELEGPHRLLLSFEGEHLGWARTNRLTLVSLKGKPLHYSNSVDLMSYLFVNFVTFSVFMERKCHICDIIVRNKLTLT